jgi:trigger factor
LEGKGIFLGSNAARVAGTGRVLPGSPLSFVQVLAGEKESPAVKVKAEKEIVDKNKVKIRVEVPAEEVDRAIDRAFRRLAREVFVPGFRRGKVPRRVLQARLGMEPVVEEVKQTDVPGYYAEALRLLELEPIDDPELDWDSISVEEGKPLVFEAEVEVKPRVEVTGYKGIEVEAPEEEATEEEVQRALESLRDRFAQLEVMEGKTLAEGDFALIDFDGDVNGKPFPGSSAKDYMLEIGRPDIWPEFNRELLGKRKGDILDIKVKMPETHPDPELAGKIASFKVLVKEVKVKKLPELNDDFAKEASSFDTLEELKADLREKISRAKKERAEETVRQRIMEKLTRDLEVDIPRKMIDRYVEARRKELEARLASRDISLQSFLQAANYTEKRMEEEFAAEAERLIKNELVLEAVARAEGISVSDRELDEEVLRRATSLGIDAEEYRQVLEERGLLEELKVDLLHEKALKFLVDNAVIAGEGEEKQGREGDTTAADEEPAAGEEPEGQKGSGE